VPSAGRESRVHSHQHDSSAKGPDHRPWGVLRHTTADVRRADDDRRAPQPRSLRPGGDIHYFSAHYSPARCRRVARRRTIRTRFGIGKMLVSPTRSGLAGHTMALPRLGANGRPSAWAPHPCQRAIQPLAHAPTSAHLAADDHKRRDAVGQDEPLGRSSGCARSLARSSGPLISCMLSPRLRRRALPLGADRARASAGHRAATGRAKKAAEWLLRRRRSAPPVRRACTRPPAHRRMGHRARAPSPTDERLGSRRSSSSTRVSPQPSSRPTPMVAEPLAGEQPAITSPPSTPPYGRISRTSEPAWPAFSALNCSPST
jgi:hypothetical protein